MISRSDPAGARLDKSQLDFCTLDARHVRLLAPAGSGKTLSVLYRCKTLAEAAPSTPRFLLFTFTRSARDELVDRLKSTPDLQGIAPLVQVTTLNAFGWRTVKNAARNAKLLTSDRDRFFTVQNVLQPVWQKHARLKALMEDSRRRNRASRDLLEAIDSLKELGLRHDRIDSLERLREQLEVLHRCELERHFVQIVRKLADLEILPPKTDPVAGFFQSFLPFYREACELLRGSALFTLDDQKYWAWIELETQLQENRHPAGSARYHHVLVDEFQDINPLDLELLRTIQALHRSTMTIVGDDDQAIYEWRGATPTFILDPEQHFGASFQTCILERNYRSPANIVRLSQRLIAHNGRRVRKDVVPVQQTNAVLKLRRHGSIVAAVEDTARLALDLLENHGCRSVALIGRKRAQIVPYQIVFAGQDVPFYAAEDLQVLLSDTFRELQEMLAIRGQAAHPSPWDDPVGKVLKLCDRVKRYPLSKKDREALNRHLRQCRPASLLDAVQALRRYQGPLKGGNEDGSISASFADAILNLVRSRTVSDSIHAISESFEGLQKDYGKALEDIFYTDPPFLYLADYAEKYGDDFASFCRDLDDAAATLALVPPADDEQAEDASWKTPLHLMTALRAKGKEFDAVIILDANDGVWPSRLAENERDLEQERRLFYVAVTRARKYLYFVLEDKILRQSVAPSRYLAEMGLDVSS